MSNNFQKPSYDIPKSDSQEIVSHSCRKLEHLKCNCQELLYKTQQSQHAQIASTNEMSEQFATILANNFAKFQVFQESLWASSLTNSIVTTAETSNTKRLLTSSTKCRDK